MSVLWSNARRRTRIMESPCNRCGCNRPFHDRWEQQSKTNWTFRQEYKRTAATHASTLAERDLRIMDLEQEQRWLQQKVKRQTAQLRRLEAKLIKLNQQPYAKEEEKSDESLLR